MQHDDLRYTPYAHSDADRDADFETDFAKDNASDEASTKRRLSSAATSQPDDSGSPTRETSPATSTHSKGEDSIGFTKEKASPPVIEGSSSSSYTHHSLSQTREYLLIFNICLAQLFSLAGLAQTVVPVIILTDAFGVGDPGHSSWFTAAYSLTLATCILPSGRLGAIYGHKRIFVIGWIWFALASLICGFSYAGGPQTFTGLRALQGIGPALLVPNGIAILGRTFPPGMKRNIAIALFGGCGPTGMVIGAVFSSIFAQLVWWPWEFWCMSAMCALVALLSIIVIPHEVVDEVPSMAPDTLPSATSPSMDEKLSWRHASAWIAPHGFDVPGALTGVTGLVLINFAFNQGPVVGWTQAYVPVLLAVGFLMMFAFLYIELRVAPYPLVPIKGLHKDAAFTLACIACGWASHGIWAYYMFLFIEQIRGGTALTACAEFWPCLPVGLSVALSVPFLLRWKVRVSYLMTAAMFFFFLGTILLVTAPPHQTYWANLFLSILLMPLAMNWSFPCGTILLSNSLPREHQGIGASLITTMVNYSISTGLGIAGTIDRYVQPDHGPLAAIRAAWWFGIALALLGLTISLYFIWRSRERTR